MDKEELEKRLAFYERKYGAFVEKRGLHNLKNLIRKPNIYELTILVMIILMLLMIPAYSYDTKICRDMVKDIGSVCTWYNSQVEFQETNHSLNITNLNFTDGQINLLSLPL